MNGRLIVCAGGLRIDYLITREGEAHCGLPGGNALYSAAGARLWADEVALWARYGRNYPHIWLDTLTAIGLDTSGLIALPGEQEHRTFFAYTEQGTREDTEPVRHFARIGQEMPAALAGYIHSTPQQDDELSFEPLALRPADIPASFDPQTAVHLAPLPLATHLQVTERLRDVGVGLISLDPGERYMIPERAHFVRQMLPRLDVFLPSAQEVRSLLGEDIDLWQAGETLLDWGAPLVVIKIGARGVLLLEAQSGLRLHLPAYHELGDPHVIDVTGAGDSFCGGFMAGLAQTADSLHAARMGLVSASMVIEGYGALYALQLDRETAVARLAEISS